MDGFLMMKPKDGLAMERSGIVLAAMAAGVAGARFNLVRIQKLQFLVDREIPDGVSGPHFEFQPHDYGPCSQPVHAVLGQLAVDHKVIIDRRGPYEAYCVSKAGQDLDQAALGPWGSPHRS